MNRLVAIVGPTGIGKSRLALHLAQVFNGEIVSADSRQVYRHMALGTARPGPEALSLVPHHLINIVNPDEAFSLAQYQGLAYQAIEDIRHRRKLPFLVGGTGQYVWAVLEGWQIPQVPPDFDLRNNLEKRAAAEGIDGLYRELVELDPAAARRIDRRNVRRVIRALEIHQKKDSSSLEPKKKPPPYHTFILGLTATRTELYGRIDRRVEEMVGQGLVAEVEKLVGMGYDLSLPALSGIGYRQIGSFLKNELTLAEAVRKIKFETHRFVRHQYSWFRLKDHRIHWFDVTGCVDSDIEAAVAGFLAGETVGKKPLS